MQFGILGPLTAAGDHGELRVPGGRQRVLLAALVVSAGRTVPAERLIDRLWGERLPANPANALQQHVFSLRRWSDAAGDGQLLITDGPGYRLAVGDEAVDARRFERLAAAGERHLEAGAHERAVTDLQAALSLWRGEALQDIDRAWAQHEARRLDELRLSTTERRIGAELALGRHARLVAELEALVAAHPLREELRGQLMVALAGSGRQADALRVYDQGRGLLVEELGVDPSPQLQAIHADVLAQRIVVAASGSGPAQTAAPPTVPSTVADRPVPRPLPAVPGRLIGRDDELRRVMDLLDGERLVTVTGAGGSGKTRLAIEVARTLGAAAGSDASGPVCEVHLVELAPVTAPETVASTVATVLGVSEHRGLRPVEALLAAFAERRALIVLDNAEHVLEPVGALADALVTRCPGVRVLTTSREPLGAPGEIVWPLPPLALPEPAVRGVAQAGQHAAVQLLVERVRAVVPDYRLSARDVDAVVRIVRHVDGLPLAIELAAARARVLSLPEIADRLHDRLGLLAGSRRTGPARHRTLRDTLEWSYEPLTDDERRAWMAAAVPVAPFTTRLLAPLLAAAGCHLDVLDAVSLLCDRSLLTVHERGRPSRYRMLETVREFGAAKLVEHGLDAQVRDAHAEAVEVVIAAGDRGTRRRWDVDLDLQRRWLPEARAALQWRLDRGDRRGAQRLAAELGWLWLLTALAPEGLRWLDAALGPIGSLDRGQTEPAAVFWAAMLRANEAPQDDGVRWAELAVDLAADEVSATVAGHVRELLRMLTGEIDVEQLVTALEPGVEPASWPEGLGRLGQGQALALTGDPGRAQRALADAERLLVDNGAWLGVWANITLAYLQQLTGDAEAVTRTVQRGLEIGARRELPELEIELLAVRAMVAAAHGDHGRAASDLEAARIRAERTGVAPSRCLVETAGGYLAWARGEPEAAVSCLRAALGRHSRLGNHYGSPFAHWVLGHAQLETGRPAEAAAQQRTAYRSAAQLRDGDLTAGALEGLAAVVVAAGGSPDVAARLLGAAQARRRAMQAPAPLLSKDAASRVEQRLRSLLGVADLDRHLVAGGALADEELGALVDAAVRGCGAVPA